MEQTVGTSRRQGWVVVVPHGVNEQGRPRWRIDGGMHDNRESARRAKRGILFARVAKAIVTTEVGELD